MLLVFIRLACAKSGEETPVPIPNTEVKLSSADGTYWATGWESRPVQALIDPVDFCGVFYYMASADSPKLIFYEEHATAKAESPPALMVLIGQRPPIPDFILFLADPPWVVEKWSVGGDWESKPVPGLIRRVVAKVTARFFIILAIQRLSLCIKKMANMSCGWYN